MIFRKIKNPLFLLLIAAGMAVVTAGCVRDQVGQEPSPASGKEMTITVSIPGQQIPTTRSMADAGGEAAVKNIDLLVFKADGTFLEHVPGVIVPPQGGAADYTVTFTAALSENANARTIAIIANYDNVATKIAGKTTKATILAELIVEETDAWKANAANVAEPEAGTDYTPIPMYGEVTVTSGITSGMKINDIPLTRMLARIDVVNSASGFALSEVYLVNYNTKGYVESKFDAGNNPVLNDLKSKNLATTKNDAIPYTYNHNDGTGFLGEIYTFEAEANSGTEGSTAHKQAICLIVKGKYENVDYYYRIDFTDDNTGLKPNEVPYMDVYRNHLYTFTISAVDGPGYADDSPGDGKGFQKALQSLGVMNNLKCTIHEINLSGIKDLVYNGQHFLGVGDEVTLSYEKDDTATVRCVTNYANGWSIDESKGTNGVTGGSGWLTVTEGTDKITLSTSSDNYTIIAAGTDRVATVHIKAGRLTHQLTVTQKGERITVTVAPTTLTLAYAEVVGTTSFTVTCTDSKGDPADVAWTLTSADPDWLRMSLSSTATFATCNADGTISDTGGQTVYIYATGNETSIPNRVTTVNIGPTTMVNITQVYAPKCFPAYPGMIGYDPIQGDLNLEGRGVMVLFKHCGVVGMYTELAPSNRWWVNDGSNVAFNPSNLTITNYNSFPTQTVDVGWSTIGHDVNPYHNVSGLKKGNGDPCRLVGFTADSVKSLLNKSILPDNNKWRMPTRAEARNCGEETPSVQRASPSDQTLRDGKIFSALNNGQTYEDGWDFIPSIDIYLHPNNGRWEIANAMSYIHTWSPMKVVVGETGQTTVLASDAMNPLWNLSSGIMRQTTGAFVRCVSQ